jgi:hypothetical protein
MKTCQLILLRKEIWLFNIVCICSTSSNCCQALQAVCCLTEPVCCTVSTLHIAEPYIPRQMLPVWPPCGTAFTTVVLSVTFV